MKRQTNAYTVMAARVSAAAVSKRLSAVHRRTEKVGYGRPFTESPRTRGYKVGQEHPYKVEVWWRPGHNQTAESVVNAYAQLREHLEAGGYDVTQDGPDARLLVTRLREPTSEEWRVLDVIAPHPIDCDRHGAAQGHGVPANVAYELIQSELALLITYPLVRERRTDTPQAFLLVLTGAGRGLLEDRLGEERAALELMRIEMPAEARRGEA